MKSLIASRKSRFKEGATNLAPAIFLLIFSVASPVTAADEGLDTKNIKQTYIANYEKNKYENIKGNSSIIRQNGNNNYSRVAQSYSSAYQLANFAHVYQDGNNNLANISQVDDNNIGIILQVGNDHNATIVQEGNNFQAKINQYGFNSDITLSQFGSGRRSIGIEQQNYSGNAPPITIDTY